MYKPVEDKRLFTHDTFYCNVDWKSFRVVVAAHQQQLEYWYILPCLELLKNPHYSFGVIALTSMLVDTLSQYENGIPKSDGEKFKDFLRKHISETKKIFKPQILTNDKKRPLIIDGADALYRGIRCGILHQAHAELYTGIVGQSKLLDYKLSGYAIYAKDNKPCPVYVVSPQMYFNKVHEITVSYWQNLIDPSSKWDDLRINFKKKIKTSFGVDIRTQL